MNDAQLKKWLWIVFVFIISLFFLFYVISRIKKHREEKTEKQKAQTESTKTQYRWEIEKTITVCFTGEYGEIRKEVLPGDNVSFENASEPYCIHNKVKEYCSQGLEDVGHQMPNSIDNGELRFKSQNGKTGSIDIIFWVWIKK